MLLSLLANLVAGLARRYAVPLVVRSVKRFPLLFAVAAAAGQAFGAWLIRECGPAADWPMAGLGALMLVFYTGLIVLVAMKCRAGTWGEFCDYVSSLVE